MNRSPELLSAELAAEERLCADRQPADPGLAADWQLRRELRGLDSRPLPEALRSRIVLSTQQRARPAWWMGLAAALLVGVSVALVLKSTEPKSQPPAVSSTDMQELNQALAVLEFSARRTTTVTGRELAASMTTTQLRLDGVPYAPQFRRWIQPANPIDQ